MELRPDGAMVYSYPDEFGTVTFNGKDISDLGLIEVLVYPDGWGRVHLTTCLVGDDFNAAGSTKKWIDGQTRTFTYYGKVTVTTP